MTVNAEQFAEKRTLAEGRCHVDFALQALLGPDLSHVAALGKLGAVSFEIFLGLLGEGQKIADDETLRAALRAVRAVQGISGVSTFEASEPAGVARALSAYRAVGGRMHLRQISDARSVPLLPAAGHGVSSEVTPHNLLLTEETFHRLGALAKVLPPLRSAADTASMQQALTSGRISIVATDHAPHTPQEKALPVENAPGGFPGVQTMLVLLLKLVAEGALTYKDVVRVACTQPARLFGLYPQKGALHPGSDADIVIVDPARPTQIRNAEQASKAARTPFDGYAVPASVVRTLLRGETIALDGRVTDSACGRFLAPVVYTSSVK